MWKLLCLLKILIFQLKAIATKRLKTKDWVKFQNNLSDALPWVGNIGKITSGFVLLMKNLSGNL